MFHVPDVGDEEELILGVPPNSKSKNSSNSIAAGRSCPRYPQQQWVTVNAITREVVNADVKQPDPERLVLCACINKYGCICYGYYDEIPRWYRIIRVLAVVFAIITTPLSLLCFIPALTYMKKAEISVQEDMVVTAREHCNSFKNWLGGGIFWVTMFITVLVIILIVITTTYVSDLYNPERY